MGGGPTDAVAGLNQLGRRLSTGFVGLVGGAGRVAPIRLADCPICQSRLGLPAQRVAAWRRRPFPSRSPTDRIRPSPPGGDGMDSIRPAPPAASSYRQASLLSPFGGNARGVIVDLAFGPIHPEAATGPVMAGGLSPRRSAA